MNLKSTLLFFAVILIQSIGLNAQSPQSFNYQAVIRNGSGNLITNQLVELRFTIKSGSSTGTTEYQESKTVTSNNFGMVNHAVGTGLVITGTFAGIT